MNKTLKNYAIILAAGTGTRFQSDIPKQFTEINGKSILEYTIECFENTKSIDYIIITTNPQNIQKVQNIIQTGACNKVCKVIAGGATRKDSSYNAISSIDEQEANILIHDGARPFISSEVIEECIKALNNGIKALTTAIPMTDTVIEVNDGIVNKMPDRNNLMRVQTPQGFKLSLIKKAHQLSEGDNSFTDDCGLILKHNLADIHIIEGSTNNIKITYPDDVFKAKNLLNYYGR